MLSLYLSILMFLSPVSQETDLEAIVKETIAETNIYRLSQGRDTLTEEPYLNELAQKHSENMAKGKVSFGHGGFDKRFKLAQKQLPIHSFAENVYMSAGEASGKDAVEAWIDSKGHRENMKNKSFKRIGVGVAVGKDGNFYFTQLFAD